MKRYLFFISQNYSFEILRPLQTQIRERGGEVRWFVYGDKVNKQHFEASEWVANSVQEVIAYQADVVFVPGNIVPAFIPGLKVQVFHGFEWKKKGHFMIRDCFDLYCTQGPLFTEKFCKLAEQHGHFDVIETGWPKLDPLFSSAPMERNNPQLPCILYAPTFSPSLCSAKDLAEKILALSHSNQWQWLVKLHPKTDDKWVDYFKNVQHDKLQVVESAEVSPVLQAADAMLSDTSSIITEFMLLGKPAVTYRNLSPEPALIDITSSEKLEEALTTALNPNAALLERIHSYSGHMHPYRDGFSAVRILDAVDATLDNGKSARKKRPKNRFRNLKMRLKLNYWK